MVVALLALHVAPVWAGNIFDAPTVVRAPAIVVERAALGVDGPTPTPATATTPSASTTTLSGQLIAVTPQTVVIHDLANNTDKTLQRSGVGLDQLHVGDLVTASYLTDHQVLVKLEKKL